MQRFIFTKFSALPITTRKCVNVRAKPICFVSNPNKQFSSPSSLLGLGSDYGDGSKFKDNIRSKCYRIIGSLLVIISGSLWLEKKVHCEGEPFVLVTDSRDCPKTKEEAIDQAKDLVQRVKDEVGSPGLVIAVHVDGKEVWSEGLGYADVENRVPCHPATVMRIASISKSMTMTIAGRLMELGKLDLDKDVRKYVSDWPEKQFEGKTVNLTTRQLVSHMAGVRHYSKLCETPSKKRKDSEKKDLEKKEEKDKEEEKTKEEFEHKEYYLKRKFPTVSSSLNLFKDDPLCFLPGSDFLYTSHGWTLISAVIEGAAKEKFPDLANEMFKELGLMNTYLDESTPLIYNRSRYYIKNKKGRLENAPYVDNSYKWAGGGFLSTVKDLCKFGDAMLYCAQSVTGKPGYLKAETIQKIWKPVENAPCGWDKDGKYAMGWCSIPEKMTCGQGRQVRRYVSHTGGAVGASSVLLVMPREQAEKCVDSKPCPQGVTVAIMVNLTGVGMNKTALQIAKIFDEAIM